MSNMENNDGKHDDINTLVQQIATAESSDQASGNLDLVCDVLLKTPTDMLRRLGDQDYFCRRNLDNMMDLEVAKWTKKERFSTEPRFFVIGEYNGLLVERKYSDWDDVDEYRLIRNLAADEIERGLPKPAPNKCKFLNGVFDHNPSDGTAKLLREYRYKSRRPTDRRRGLEILTIDRDQSWRAVNLSLEPDEETRTSGKEDIHFCRIFNNGEDREMLRVRTFDLKSESFQTNTLCLNKIFQNLSNPSLLMWGNRLGVANIYQENLQVLLFEKQEQGDYKWGEEIKEVLLNFLRNDYFKRGRDKITPLKLVSGTELWFKFSWNVEYYFCYDLNVMSIIQRVGGGDEDEAFLEHRTAKTLERKKLSEEKKKQGEDLSWARDYR